MRERLILGFVLLVVYLAAGFARVHVQKSVAHFDPNDGTAFYWTEGAVQFRYARMVAEGEAIPSWDQALQYPEGVHPFRHLTIAMEYAGGLAYRWLAPVIGNPPLHLFLIWFTGFFAALSVPAAFLLAKSAFHSPLAGLLAASLLAFSSSAAGRMAGSYGREDFALPFLLGALALLVAAGEDRRPRWQSAILAGAFLATGLASWHFARFFHLIVAVVVAIWYVRGDADRRLQSPFIAAFCVITLFAGAAGALIPVLREKQFLLSPSMAISVAVMVDATIGGVLPIRRASIRLGFLCLLLLLPGILMRAGGDGYGHVWALLAAKVAHLGVKPADPAKLSFDARLLWIEAFRSPSIYYVASSFGIPFVLGVAGVARFHRRRKSGNALSPALFMTFGVGAIFLILLMLVQRMSVFAIFYLAVAAGGLYYRSDRRRSVVITVILGGIVAFLAGEFVKLHETTPYRAFWRKTLNHTDPVVVHNWHLNDTEVVRWISRHTPNDAVFASRIGVGPMVLTYAGRSIALQPKFEASGIREKSKDFLSCLYGSEDDLLDFCRRNGVTHLLFDARSALDTSVDGDRYTAGITKLPRESVAYWLHFTPEKLLYFSLVHQNSFYRVYEIVEPPAFNESGDLPYQPIFTLRRFGNQPSDSPYFDDTHTAKLVAALDEAVNDFQTGRALFDAGRYDEALIPLRRAAKLHPSLVGANTYLGMTHAFKGNLRGGLARCIDELRLTPDSPLAWYNLGYVRYLMKNYRGALEAWKKTESLAPEYPGLSESITELERYLEDAPDPLESGGPAN